MVVTNLFWQQSWHKNQTNLKWATIFKTKRFCFYDNLSVFTGNHFEVINQLTWSEKPTNLEWETNQLEVRNQPTWSEERSVQNQPVCFMVTKKLTRSEGEWNHKSNVCVCLKNQCLFKVSMAHEMDQGAKGSWPRFCKYLQDMGEGLVISVRPVKSVWAFHWYTTWHVSFCCCEHAVLWTTCLKGMVFTHGTF